MDDAVFTVDSVRGFGEEFSRGLLSENSFVAAGVY